MSKEYPVRDWTDESLVLHRFLLILKNNIIQVVEGNGKDKYVFLQEQDI